MKSHLLEYVLPLVLFMALARAAAADDAGIRVTGTGEVKAKPTRLEIALHASGSAELTADAVVKYRDALKNTLDAYDKLKVENLKIEQEGLGIESAGPDQRNNIRIGIMGKQSMKTQIDVSRGLRLVLTGIDAMTEEQLTEIISKLLDAAKDTGAGLSENPNSMMARIYGQQLNTPAVMFVVDNVAEVREKAYQLAFKEAEAKAQNLAKLAGAKLGPVLSIEDSGEAAPEAASSRQQKMFAAIYGIGDATDKQDTRIVTDKMGEVPVRIGLHVRFALQGKGSP